MGYLLTWVGEFLKLKGHRVQCHLMVLGVLKVTNVNGTKVTVAHKGLKMIFGPYCPKIKKGLKCPSQFADSHICISFESSALCPDNVVAKAQVF